MAGEAQHARITLAVWDIPPTVVAGERFEVKVGAKSSADCDLRGCRIEVCDTAGAVVGSGELGAARWPGTSLAWTALSLPASAEPGLLSFQARFRGGELVPPHRDARFRFAVMAVPPPQHTVMVAVVAKETSHPIAGAEIRIGSYRGLTGPSGCAAIPLAKGDYDLRVWKLGFDALPARLHVENDAAVRIEADTVPEENADRAWRG